MRKELTIDHLRNAAAKVGLEIQHDCSGYRVVQDTGDGGWRNIFPEGGICPTESKKACAGFLLGVLWQQLQLQTKKEKL
jgi:hypothetical protein